MFLNTFLAVVSGEEGSLIFKSNLIMKLYSITRKSINMQAVWTSGGKAGQSEDRTAHEGLLTNQRPGILSGGGKFSRTLVLFQ